MWHNKIKNFKEAEEYILGIPKFTKKNTMEDSNLFYQYLGRPGNQKKIIHVAGTNGKGSVCAFLNQILVESGYRVGMFTSPHLVSMKERIRIDSAIITEEMFYNTACIVMEQVAAFNDKNEGTKSDYHPTFFELIFFITMVIFQKSGVEFIILETGLGGRYDATNLISSPAICVITKIGMDHMEYLGDTIDKIASEKAGIIKESCPVVFYSGSDIVKNVIEKRASHLHAPLHDVRPQDISLYKFRDKSIDFYFNSRYYGYVTLSISGSALYQMQNAALAVETIGLLDGEKRISIQKIIQAVSHMKWDGRMEEILPDVYLDGAHNEDGIDAFLETVQAGGNKHNLLLFSVVKDKDYSTMIHKLVEKDLFETIVITVIPGNRGLSLKQMEKTFKQYTDKQVIQYNDPMEAFRRCVERKEKEGKMYVVGSLYLVGLVKGENND